MCDQQCGCVRGITFRAIEKMYRYDFDFRVQVKENVSSGTVGERGEGWVAAQFALIFLVITGPLFSETLEGVETLLGLPLCLAGIALGGLTLAFFPRTLPHAETCCSTYWGFCILTWPTRRRSFSVEAR